MTVLQVRHELPDDTLVYDRSTVSMLQRGAPEGYSTLEYTLHTAVCTRTFS